METKLQKNIQNLVPLPYRHVSVQPYTGLMTEAAIEAHLLGKDSYRRTRYVVLENGDKCAVAAVSRASETPLFSDLISVETLALPDTCTLVEDPTVDPGSPSALAAKAKDMGLGPDSTLVVRGLYQHVNFIHRPNPLKIRVIEVTPPYPPKTLGLARKVLSYATLPPIEFVSENFELQELAAAAPQAEALLIPCRASGLDFNKPTYFLDERPPRHNWTMIACERSRQIHQHFYGDKAPRLEMCPRKLTQDNGMPTLVKCCLLEEDIEVDGNWVVVPWGATLAHVEAALKILADNNE